ncbi:DUF1707 and DUF4870 domain-containing protein [Streptosporangium sp. NPDC023615]|uniref:DUF1707 and DUF4870 domain-containing protein n=1 Tax=Streptosporangium sp. NPDC023615 TaxID=3154794 RepID=UPI003414A4F8
MAGLRPDHPTLRVGNQDREQVVEHVKAAYAEGRLDRLEFEDRLERAMTARVHGDLIPIMDELHGGYPARPVSSRFPGDRSASAYPGRLGGRGDTGGDRLGAAAAHLLPLAGLPVVGPLVMMLTAGRNSPYIRAHSVEALNFQLTLLAATILLTITIVGAVLVPLVWIGGVVLSVVGGVAGASGGDFRYPLTVRMVQ